MDMRFSRASRVGLISILFASPALSAELPSRNQAPPQPARTCEIDGKPGYKPSGSDICLRIGGYVSGQVSAGNLK